MRHRLTMLMAALGLAVLAQAAAAAEKDYEVWAKALGVDTQQSYQAVRVMETAQGRFEMVERRAPGKHYMESNMGGMQAIILVREDRNTSYMLMPAMNMYREMPVSQAQAQASSNVSLAEVKKLGQETINGFRSTKYQAQFQDNNGQGEGFVWVTDDGVPIRWDMEYATRGMQGQRLVMELKDLKVGPQPADIFEIPPHYRPMNLGNMMGAPGMPGMGGRP